jgi:phosphatidate cytidylyltransferase
MTKPAPNTTKWDDLTVRLASSAVMVVVGAFGVIMGGVWFQMLVVFVTAVMVWELWMMIRPDEPTKGMLLATLVAAVMSGQLVDGTLWGMLLFLVVPVIGATQLKTGTKTFFIFALGIQLAGWGLVHFRMDYGFFWLLWLMSVVIVTDIFGYFAGKSLGGPKFWPAICPKRPGAAQPQGGLVRHWSVLSSCFSPMRGSGSS